MPVTKKKGNVTGSIGFTLSPGLEAVAKAHINNIAAGKALAAGSMIGGICCNGAAATKLADKKTR